MSRRFTIGIEEEFQLIDRQSGELASRAPYIIEKGAAQFGERIKQETLQSMLELVSDILPDIEAARSDLYEKRGQLVRFLADEGLSLISAGTHPSSPWEEQRFSEGERYEEMADEYQDMLRSDVIFGLHVHIGVEDKELAIQVMNYARSWLPHLLALSTNSAFLGGRMTGLKSYRSVQWRRFSRSGIPPLLENEEEFETYVRNLIEMGAIDDGKKIWWDLRPHPYFGTLEFRICDMPLTIEDTLAIAALCQALIAKLVGMVERGERQPLWKRSYIEENKWKVMRYGLDAPYMDFINKRHLTMREACRELLAFVDDVVDKLGSRRELEYLQALLTDPRGNGADRQIAAYQASGDVRDVVSLLRKETLRGIEVA